MQKKVRILSMLIALCMILSPISLAVSRIANAEGANVDMVDELGSTKDVKSLDEGEDLTKPASIELSFPGGEQVTPLYPGGKQIIWFKVFDGYGVAVKGEKITFESSNPNVLKHSFLDTFTAGEVEEETEVTITAKLKSNSDITGSIKVIVSPKEKEEPIVPVNLDEERNFLKQCDEAYMTEDSNGNTGNAGLSMLAPGAARLAGMDVGNIQRHLYIDEKNESAYQLSQSIITLIGADLDPRQYDDKGKVRNLVKELADSQQADGENKGNIAIRTL